MHTNFIRILAATVLLTALPACDGGAPPKADAKKVAAKAKPRDITRLEERLADRLTAAVYTWLHYCAPGHHDVGDHDGVSARR